MAWQTGDKEALKKIDGVDARVDIVDAEIDSLTQQLADTTSEIDLINRGKGAVSILEYENLKVLTATVYDWTPAIQAAIDSGVKKVTFPNGIFYSSTIEIPSTISELEGVGANATRIVHLGSGALIQKKSSSNRIRDFSIKGFYLEGNGSPTETHGIDLTGFSYGSILNVRCRLFTLDGMYGKGDITPINNQLSNITFVNVTSNNNKRHGIKLDGSTGIENTALTFIGGEFAGNIANGIHIDFGEKIVFYGTTIQGNGVYDVYDNGRINSYNDCWVENAKAKTVFLGTASRGITFNRPKTSYPLWNFIVDKGKGNTIIPDKQNGLTRPKVLNTNPLLENPDSNGVPQGITKHGAITMLQIDDDLTINKKAIRFTATADYLGYVINLTQHPSYLKDKWVTVRIRYKANTVDGVTHRMYTRFGTANNGVGGQIVTETFENTNGEYVTRLFDIKFAAEPGVETTASIIHYLTYSNGAGNTNVIDIAEIEVLL